MKVCPKCGSRELDYASLRKESGALLGLGLPQDYYCTTCGYTGPLILQLSDKEYEKLSKKGQFRHHRKYQPITVGRHASPEIIKPAMAVVFIVFLASLVFFTIPKYTYAEAPGVALGARDNFLIAGKETGDYKAPAGAALTVGEFAEAARIEHVTDVTAINQVSTATGLQDVASFSWYLFILLFSVGIVGMLLTGAVTRSRLFE